MTPSVKPKLLVLTSSFPRGQHDKDPSFIFELCHRLTAHFEVHVVAPHSEGTACHETFTGLHIMRFRYFHSKYETLTGPGGIMPTLARHPWRYFLIPFFILGQSTTVCRLLRKHDYRAMHAHWLLPQGFVAVLARWLLKSPVPVVCTAHGSDMFALKGNIFDTVRRVILNHTDAVTFVSRALREKARALSGHTPHTAIIPMGVDLLQTFVPSDSPRHKSQILFAGRLIQSKGIQYLIRAMPTVLRVHPHATLMIAGTGPYAAALKREAAALKVEHHVTFLGLVENRDLPALYQTSTMFVLPSLSEGFGLVLVEALGCECPVIATDLPAIRDIIVNGKTGLTARTKNPDDLADKIVYLLQNPAVRKQLGTAGRKYVHDRYAWEIITDRYAQLIARFVPPHHPETSSKSS